MNRVQAIAIGGAATLVVIGGLVYSQLDNWFSTEPTGPGSGDEVDLGNGPGEPGPGSGDEVIPGDPNFDPSLAEEPRGPGSDDFYNNLEDDEPTGPGSGDEVDLNEPTGPGSDDFYQNLEDDEPTGPGSGDEYSVVGSCNDIAFGSTCVDYIGSFWATIKDSITACSNVGTWSDSPCPTNYVGGCNLNSGTAEEMTTWHYSYGGDPFDGAATQAAITACTLSPFGSWIAGGI